MRFPNLIRWTKADWGKLTRSEHLQSLMTDLRNSDNDFPYEADNALITLKFFFPEAYAGLDGRLLDKRHAFERTVCRVAAIQAAENERAPPEAGP